MKKIPAICFAVLVCFSIQTIAQIPTTVLVQIVRAEDERRFDKTLEDLMKNANEKIRARAALAAGRIGDERAVPILINLLENDTEAVRPTAAFALGEVESIKAADAIFKVLKNPNALPAVRARLVEAAGKIAAANDAKDANVIKLGETILDVLTAESNESKQDRLTVLLGLTAILRAKPTGGDVIAAKFLTNSDARIRADAANTLSRIKATNANVPLRAMLLSDNDAIARANAARALGAAEDADAFDLLLEAATSDKDSRVRASAIRSLGSLKNARAADKLLERGAMLLADYKKSKSTAPNEKSELLEIAAALGKILPNSADEKAIEFLTRFRILDQLQSPEIEIAFARISPLIFMDHPFLGRPSEVDKVFPKLADSWQTTSAWMQGIGELANAPDASVEVTRSKEIAKINTLSLIQIQLSDNSHEYKMLSDELRAYAGFKTKDLPEVLRGVLKNKDVFVRATAAELISELPPSEENVQALKSAFGKSVTLQELMPDKNYNDAQLAIITALAKQDKGKETIKLLFPLALQSPDYLVRRHTVNVIKQNNLEKDIPEVNSISNDVVRLYQPKSITKLGQILNTNADYLRAVSRKTARAILTTEKGTFTIEFFPEAAPLTVDNFIKLAEANYFNGLAIHRVVPNFVMQDGDPRGDGNGGPGWQIRCELNMESYERGAVGMALSGKDTGGSQWFVTHSPQPHLDGGYTVFGKVNESDMKIVDTLVRGDKILSVKIIEGGLQQRTQRKSRKKS